MKKTIAALLCLVLVLGMLAACGKTETAAPAENPAPAQTEQTAEPEKTEEPAKTEEPEQTAEPEKTEEPEQTAEPEKTEESEGEKSGVASADDMTEVVDVVEEGMVPVPASDLVDGSYDVVVDSSSSMFKIVSARLNVSGGAMELVLTMKSEAYGYMFADTAEKAAAAAEADLIPLVAGEGELHTFTLPIDALDAPITCAAYSVRKELWYDRTLLARSDSLPLEAFNEASLLTPDKLGLADGEYTVAVTLSGGSGKTTVESPAKLTVSGGAFTATVVFSSPNYDYVLIGDTRYEPVNTEGNSAFELPVSVLDRPMGILADTTAMSTPHEIAYTLRFDSASIAPAA